MFQLRITLFQLPTTSLPGPAPSSCTPPWRIRLKVPFLALPIVRRTPPVLLGKMGLISDRSVCFKKRPYQIQMKLFKSNDCEGFCLYTDFYGGAIKRSSNCQTSIQFLPLSSYLNLPLSYAPFSAITSRTRCLIDATGQYRSSCVILSHSS